MEASFFSKPLSQSECRIKITSQLLSESEYRNLGHDLTQKTQTNKMVEVQHNADKDYLLGSYVTLKSTYSVTANFNFFGIFLSNLNIRDLKTNLWPCFWSFLKYVTLLQFQGCFEYYSKNGFSTSSGNNFSQPFPRGNKFDIPENECSNWYCLHKSFLL